MTTPAHDPFAPPVPRFPETRLTRAGLNADQVAKVRAEWDEATPSQRRTTDRAIRSVSNADLRAKYGDPEPEPVEPMSVLEGLKVAELSQRLEDRKLPHSGTKAELLERLRPLAAAEPGEQPPNPVDPPAPPAGPVVVTETQQQAEGQAADQAADEAEGKADAGHAGEPTS